jgi:hypothetical protein
MCHPSRTKKFHKQAAKNTFYARLSVAKNAAIFLSFEVSPINPLMAAESNIFIGGWH